MKIHLIKNKKNRLDNRLERILVRIWVTRLEKYCYSHVSLNKAKKMLHEGAAAFVNVGEIEKLHERQAFRKMIQERDHDRCHYCGCMGETIDHLIPKYHGGITSPVNCVWCCEECNRLKGHMSYYHFKQIIQQEQKR